MHNSLRAKGFNFYIQSGTFGTDTAIAIGMENALKYAVLGALANALEYTRWKRIGIRDMADYYNGKMQAYQNAARVIANSLALGIR